MKRTTKTDRALDAINQDIEAYKKCRSETDRLIAETVQHMATAGRMRRIRPCDMDDPAETECPVSSSPDLERNET